MSYGDCGCEYPRCGGGRRIGSHFCPKHIKTPFTSKAEVNAYRRGQRDGRAEIIAANEAVLRVVEASKAWRAAPFVDPHNSTSTWAGAEREWRKALDALPEDLPFTSATPKEKP